MSTKERAQESPELTYEEKREAVTSLIEKAITSLKDSAAFQRAVMEDFFSEFLSFGVGTQAINVPTAEGYCRVIVIPGHMPILTINRYVDAIGNPLLMEGCTLDPHEPHIGYQGTMPGETTTRETRVNTASAVEGAENLIAFVANTPLLGDEEADALAAGDSATHSL